MRLGEDHPLYLKLSSGVRILIWPALTKEIGASQGVLVAKSGSQSAPTLTYKLISEGADTLFEPTFVAPPFIARADILLRHDGGWHVLEAKSSFSDTTKVDDLAYTVWILGKAGLKISRASLPLLSRAFRFGNGPEQLFEVIDQTAEAVKRAAEFEAGRSDALTTLFDGHPPQATLKSACRECERFGDTCLRTGAAHTVLEIPQLHHTKLKKLAAAGITDLADVPADLNLNERQQRAREAALFREYGC